MVEETLVRLSELADEDEVETLDDEPDVDIASTWLKPEIATYTFPLALSKTIPAGEVPTFIVRTTVLFEPEITDTVLLPVFVTKISPSVEAYAAPKGCKPTLIVATTEDDEGETTVTLFPAWSAT